MHMKKIKLADYDDPKSLGSRFRAKRMAPLIELINRVFEQNGSVKLLDVGGRKTYWKALPPGFLQERDVTITILNIPSDLQGEDDSVFKHVVGDACDMPQFSDNEFDVVHSNSVIEHVGGWEKIRAFAREVRRVAPNVFVQTPAFWFPVEPHFIKPFHHWMPRSLRISMFMRFRMGHRGRAANLEEAIRKVEDEPYLLDYRMFQLLFPEEKIIRERFLFFTKSMVAYRNSFLSNA